MTPTCEVCGTQVTPEDPGAIVIEYFNLLPAYSEEYGFCADHAPSEEELRAVKERIKAGRDPVA